MGFKMESINQIKKLILNFFSEAVGTDSRTYKIINERMQNLEVQVMDKEEFETYYKGRMGNNAMIPSGFYDHQNRKAVFKSANYGIFRILETAVHEIIHALSDNGTNKLGLIQYDKGLGKGFNEMTTCYITSKILGKGYGGAYSQDYREVFKMFLTTMKMQDNELFEKFFQPENWITKDEIDRFNQYDSSALINLIELYDKRQTRDFDANKVIEIIEQSAIINQIQGGEAYNENLLGFCDYFEITLPIKIGSLTQKL